jgi:hypothetical protein
MARDVYHFFMYLLAISTSSFKNCLFSSSSPLLIGLSLYFHFFVVSYGKITEFPLLCHVSLLFHVCVCVCVCVCELLCAHLMGQLLLPKF